MKCDLHAKDNACVMWRLTERLHTCEMRSACERHTMCFYTMFATHMSTSDKTFPYCQADASEKLQANVQINKTTCVSSMDLAMEESCHLVIHLLTTNLVLPTNAEAEAYWEALANQFASDQEADQ